MPLSPSADQIPTFLTLLITKPHFYSLTISSWLSHPFSFITSAYKSLLNISVHFVFFDSLNNLRLRRRKGCVPKLVYVYFPFSCLYTYRVGNCVWSTYTVLHTQKCCVYSSVFHDLLFSLNVLLISKSSYYPTISEKNNNE